MDDQEDKTLLPLMRLKLNIAYPDFEECWLHGYEAAQQELTEDNNPYKEGTSEYDHWCNGWWDGCYADKPAVQMSKTTTNKNIKSNQKQSALSQWHKRKPFRTFNNPEEPEVPAKKLKYVKRF